MKKIVNFFSVLCVLLIGCFVCACDGGKKDASTENESVAPENSVSPVAIYVTETVESGTTLLEYMEVQKEKGEITFVVSGGMITSINGVENDADYDPCWMLYTSDEDNANTMWGSFEYNGSILGSAVVGASDLVIKQGYTYVWVYQGF